MADISAARTMLDHVEADLFDDLMYGSTPVYQGNYTTYNGYTLEPRGPPRALGGIEGRSNGSQARSQPRPRSQSNAGIGAVPRSNPSGLNRSSSTSRSNAASGGMPQGSSSGRNRYGSASHSQAGSAMPQGSASGRSRSGSQSSRRPDLSNANFEYREPRASGSRPAESPRPGTGRPGTPNRQTHVVFDTVPRASGQGSSGTARPSGSSSRHESARTSGHGSSSARSSHHSSSRRGSSSQTSSSTRPKAPPPSMTYGEWSALAAIALGSTASMTTANFPQVPSWGCCKDKQGMRKLVACEHEIERMVTKLANYGEIVAAFKNEMRRWHPDRFVSVPEPHKREVQAMAQELYQAFNNAKEKMDRPRSSWD